MFRRSVPFVILAAALVAFNFSLGVSRTIQGNFWVDELGVRPDEIAVIITARETIGFLTIVLVAATMRLAPARLASACFVVMAVGYYLYGLATSYLGALPGIILASAGFHIWSTLNGAFGLAVAKQEDAGQVLGDLQSVGFIAGLAGIAIVYAGVNLVGYQAAFAVSGVAMLLGSAIILRFPGEIVHRSSQRAVVRRRYGLYYILNFFEGCRFEFYQTFGVFLLVEHYHLPVQTIAILFVATSIGNVVFSPIIGRLIDRFGERPVLTVGYLGMFVTFAGFALWNSVNAAIGLYVAYNTFILTEIGVNTYLKKVADPGDVRPSLATGLTVMHIPALVVPILGGLLWTTFGYAVPFLVGCGFIVASLIATQAMPRHAGVARVVSSATA